MAKNQLTKYKAVKTQSGQNSTWLKPQKAKTD